MWTDGQQTLFDCITTNDVDGMRERMNGDEWNFLKNEQGEDAVEYALRIGQMDCLQWMLDQGAYQEFQEIFARFPECIGMIEIALFMGRMEFVRTRNLADNATPMRRIEFWLRGGYFFGAYRHGQDDERGLQGTCFLIHSYLPCMRSLAAYETYINQVVKMIKSIDHGQNYLHIRRLSCFVEIAQIIITLHIAFAWSEIMSYIS